MYINDKYYIPLTPEDMRVLFDGTEGNIIRSNDTIYPELYKEYQDFLNTLPRTKRRSLKIAPDEKNAIITIGDEKIIGNIKATNPDTGYSILLAPQRAVELMLCTKAFTFAAYPMSVTIQNILHDVVSCIQGYLTNDIEKAKIREGINISLCSDDYPVYLGHHEEFYKDMIALNQIVGIEFQWTNIMLNSPEAKGLFVDKFGNPIFGKDAKIKSCVPIFEAISISEEPKHIIATLNRMAIPFLIYHGKGVGGTQYSKKIEEQLDKRYSKRLYPMFMDFTNLPDVEHKIKIKELKRILNIPSGYSNYKIKSSIIEPALNDINGIQSDYVFSAEIRASDKCKGKKPSLDTLFITVKFKNDNRKIHENNVAIIKLLLKEIADKQMEEACNEACQIIFERGLFNKIYAKYKFYGEQLKRKKISQRDFKNIMLSIIRDLTGIELRTQIHILNSMKYMRRKERANKVKNLGEILK